MTDPREDHLRLRLLSDPRYLCVARATVATALRKLGYAEEVITQVELVVDEAVGNVIRHGYDNDPHRPIWVAFAPLVENGVADPAENNGAPPTGFRIIIEDNARQVDPQNICGRDLADIRPGGLGVHIIKSYMDDVTYEPRAEGGMRLTLVRHLPPGQSPPRKKQSADASTEQKENHS